MGYPPLEELLPKAGNSIYKLVRLAAVRAIELADGKPKLIPWAASDKTPTTALEEIRCGKVVLREQAANYAPKKRAAKPADEEEPVTADS